MKYPLICVETGPPVSGSLAGTFSAGFRQDLDRHSCVPFSATSVGTECSRQTDILVVEVRSIWRQHTCVTNCVDQQTLKLDDDYVLPHQRLWTFDVGLLVCPLSVTERFLLQSLVCGTNFRCTSLLSPLSQSSAVVVNHISSHSLIRLSDSSPICTVPFLTL